MADFKWPDFRPDPVIKTAKEVEAFADRMLTQGRTRVNAMFHKVPLISSFKVFVQKEDAGRDETHYFLVPFQLSDEGFAFYSARRLPEGYAATNDLDKVRVFHVAAKGGEQVLEHKVFADLTEVHVDSGESTLAQRLNALGDELDKHAEKITGGMLVIGTTVALINPALGAAIALKALIPGVAGKLSKHGFRYGGDKLEEMQASKGQKAAEKKARKELKRAEVEVVINPLLATLERALKTNEAEFDPLLEFDPTRFEVEGFRGPEMLALTSEAVFSVYEDVLGHHKHEAQAGLGPEDVRWLETLRGWADIG